MRTNYTVPASPTDLYLHTGYTVLRLTVRSLKETAGAASSWEWINESEPNKAMNLADGTVSQEDAVTPWTESVLGGSPIASVTLGATTTVVLKSSDLVTYAVGEYVNLKGLAYATSVGSKALFSDFENYKILTFVPSTNTMTLAVDSSGFEAVQTTSGVAVRASHADGRPISGEYVTYKGVKIDKALFKAGDPVVILAERVAHGHRVGNLEVGK